MGAYYVGLDVHSQDTVFVIQDEAGAIRARGAIPTTPDGLARWREEHELPTGTTVALETGTSAFYVARQLAALDLRPIVVDAHEVRRKASRPTQKSDRRDAFELCDGVRRGFYRAVVHGHRHGVHHRQGVLHRQLRPDGRAVRARRRAMPRVG